jgi:aquaporin Z
MSEPTSMIKLFLAELVGTFVFLSIIIITIDTTKKGYFKGDAWWKIAIGLGAAIAMVGGISGGQLNPAVSFMLYLNEELSIDKLGVYIVAQLIGATLACVFFKFFKDELQELPA